jgi:hypothetical protein
MPDHGSAPILVKGFRAIVSADLWRRKSIGPQSEGSEACKVISADFVKIALRKNILHL